MKKKSIFNRYMALFLIMVLLFTGIITRLFYLQVVNADEYAEMANNKEVRYVTECSPRGDILDRNGLKLATNIQSYNIVFVETEESISKFLETFKKVFSILDKQTHVNEKGGIEKEKLQDDFELKINPFCFQFKSEDPKVRRAMELRFKKDRGFDFRLKSRLFPNRKDNLTGKENQLIEEEVLNITPEEVFYDLVIQYDLYRLLNLSKEEENTLINSYNSNEITAKEITDKLLEKYSLEDIRKFMLVRDAVKMQSFSGYKPVTVASNLDRSTAFIFEQLKSDLPGIDITMQPIRYYPYSELGSSFIGYISKISGDKKDRFEERGYDCSSDYIGVAGLESAFEDRLRGSKGGTTVRVNKQGRKIKELFRLDAYQGQSLMLTIDKNLQSVAEKALNDEMRNLQINNTHGKDPVNTANATRGAAVVLDVNTGSILALASNPGLDPNVFAVPGRLTPELYKQYFAPDLAAFGEKYITDKKLNRSRVSVDTLFPVDTSIKGANIRKDYYDIYPKPFFNYATSSLIPPGSTFKPLTGIAGMEEKVIDANTRIYDAQIFDEHGKDTENYKGACWIWNEYRGSHGRINIKTALEESCNYFFFELGWRLFNKERNLDALAKYAWKFGLGTDPKSNSKPSTGIEIYENFGQVYNQQSRRNVGAFTAVDGAEYYLKAGKYVAGSGGTVRFTPINISENTGDSSNLKVAKKAIKDAIRDNVQSETAYAAQRMNIMYLNTKRDFIPLFSNLINNLPEDVKSQYKKEDAAYMAEAISTYVNFDIKTTVVTPGNIYDASIGQGMNQFTPLQLTNYIATFVNGGNRYKLHLVDKFLDPDKNVIEQVKPEVVEKINLSPSTISTIKEGMLLVTTGEDGTATNVFDHFPIKTAGKTGSATSIFDQEAYGRTSFGIYLGFAPYAKPEIAVCVVIFDGGHGGYVAPVARALYECYFRDSLKNNPAFVPSKSYTINP